MLLFFWKNKSKQGVQKARSLFLLFPFVNHEAGHPLLNNYVTVQNPDYGTIPETSDRLNTNF